MTSGALMREGRKGVREGEREGERVGKLMSGSRAEKKKVYLLTETHQNLKGHLTYDITPHQFRKSRYLYERL